MLHNRHPGALGPHGQLLGSGGAEGIARTEHHLAPDGLEAQRQLANGGGLAHAVHAHHQHHHGPLQRRTGDVHLLHHDVLQHIPGLGCFLHIASLHPLAQFVHDGGGGLHATVGQEEDVLQLLVEILVNLPGFLDQVVHLVSQVAAGFAQALPQAGEQALFLRFAHISAS